MSVINLIKNTINGEEVETVNARDLHKFLEVGKDFSNWIKDRITKYEFTNEVDFTTHMPNLHREVHGGRNKIDYYLKLNMAQEIALAENKQKGIAVRKYFIERENLLVNNTGV